MRYFKCVEWNGTWFTAGKVYPVVDNCIIHRGTKDPIHFWMKPLFIEVTFSKYLEEVENL